MSNRVPAPRCGYLPDWFVDLKHIPGTVSAIARLVRGAAMAGAAWEDIAAAEGESRAQAIRDETTARSLITKEAAKAVAKQIGRDPELAERALGRFVGDITQKQENREAVAFKAVEHLREDSSEQAPESGPDDDWMNIFESYAEKASSERFREHWARILAGEIRRHGTFSLLTLQFMSVLDRQMAEVVERIHPYVCDDGLLIIPDRKDSSGRFLLDIVTLESIGFLQNGLARTYPYDEEGRVVLQFGDAAILIERPNGHPSAKLDVPGALLTNIGREVLSVISRTKSLSVLEEIARFILSDGAQKVTIVHNLRRADGGLSGDAYMSIPEFA